MAELAKEQRDPRKRPRTENNYPRGRAQGLEARITAAPPKEKEDDLEEVVSLGGTEDEEMPDFGSSDIYGDPSFEGPYNQGDDDGDIEIAELAGIAYWQVPPTSLVTRESNNIQTDVDISPVCNMMLISCCSHKTCECHNVETKDWMIDSGASLHFTGEIDDFVDYTEINHKFGVSTANSSATVVGKGTIILMLDSGSTIRLQPVYHVPGLTSRLLSMGTFLAQGFQAIGTQSFIRIVRAGQPFLTFVPRYEGDSIYVIRSLAAKEAELHSAVETVYKIDYEIMHKRMAHPSKDVIIHARKHLKDFPEVEVPSKENLCPGCAQGKMSNRPFPANPRRANAPFELIHSDLKSFPIESYRRFKYVIIFLDDYTSNA